MTKLAGKKILVVGDVSQRVIDRLIELGAFVTKESINEHYGRINGMSFDQIWIDEVVHDKQSEFLRSPSPDLYWMGHSGVRLP